MEWQEKRASELYISSSGLSKSADQFGFGYPFLSYKDIFNNYYAPDKLLTLVNSSEIERKKCSVKRGDVFLTRTSETTDELGMSCVALKDYPEATFNGFSKRLRPITEEIVPEYAAYYFRSSFFRNQCKSLASLITRASLNDGMISRLKIRYPQDRSVQEKIGSILLLYDNLIENNNKRIRLLEQMAENLYKEWFVRFRFPGHEKAEFENGLPKGWSKGSLGDVMVFQNGFAFKSESFMDEGRYSIVTIKNVKDDGFDGSKTDKIGEIPPKMPNYCKLSEGDILISLTGNVGRVCRVFGKDYLLNQRVAKVKSDYNYFIYSLLRTDAIFAALNNISYGTAQLNLSPVKAKKIKIIVPPDSIQKKFNDLVSTFFQSIDVLKTKNDLLSRQRDLLLPRLMSGKLEVNI